MSEKRDKVTVDDIIGLIHTDEPTNSVELKKDLYRTENNDSTNSENEKRFTLAYEKGNWWAVRDYDITLWKEEVISLLNELYEENEQLKSELGEKDIQLDFLKAENNHMSDLVNENGQLKKENQKLMKAVGESSRMAVETLLPKDEDTLTLNGKWW